MQTRPQTRSPLLAALALVLLAAAWLALAPVQFGGTAAYVIVDGNSMEPTFHRGDLVIVRSADAYQVGDIVTYQHPQIGPVIHRIIGRAGDRLIIQGDHNTWIDSYRPTEQEVIGAFWLHLPSAGRTIGWVRRPLNMAILFAIVGVLPMANIVLPPDAQRRRRLLRSRANPEPKAATTGAGRPPAGPARRRPSMAEQFDQRKESLLLGLAVLTFASLLLTVFAFTQPLTREVTDQLAYTQSGAFDYTANVPDVYQGGRLRAGEPVFRQLISAIDLSFSYELSADQPHELGGSYQLQAELSDENGWARTLELAPPGTFSGSSFNTHGRLDLAQVQGLIDTLEGRAGIVRQQYTLAIVPKVTVDGTLGGQSLRERFAPRLEFRLDKLELSVRHDQDTSDPLKPSQPGMITAKRSVPKTIGAFGLALPVATARWLPLIGVVLALAGAALYAWRASAASQATEAARIQFKYGPLLIAVRGGALDAGAHIVEVDSIDDLAKLAERDQLVILHERRDGACHYYVQDVGVTYHYQADAPQHGQLATQHKGDTP